MENKSSSLKPSPKISSNPKPTPAPPKPAPPTRVQNSEDRGSVRFG